MGTAGSINFNNPWNLYIHPRTKLSLKMFLLNTLIGEGGFGSVWSGMFVRNQQWYAIKAVNKNELVKHKTGLSMLRGELAGLQRIDHPLIISLHFAFQDKCHFYFVLDLRLGGDLRYYLRKKLIFEERDVAFYVACMSSALEHIHSKNMIHRDIKPENIILDERGYPYLADFGVAHVQPINDSGDPLVSCLASGTKQYLAPEVFCRSHIHGPESDFWSLGVVAYELLFGKRPFDKHCPTPFIAYLEKALANKRVKVQKEQRLKAVVLNKSGGINRANSPLPSYTSEAKITSLSDATASSSFNSSFNSSSYGGAESPSPTLTGNSNASVGGKMFPPIRSADWENLAEGTGLAAHVNPMVSECAGSPQKAFAGGIAARSSSPIASRVDSEDASAVLLMKQASAIDGSQIRQEGEHLHERSISELKIVGDGAPAADVDAKLAGVAPLRRFSKSVSFDSGRSACMLDAEFKPSSFTPPRPSTSGLRPPAGGARAAAAPSTGSPPPMMKTRTPPPPQSKAAASRGPAGGSSSSSTLSPSKLGDLQFLGESQWSHAPDCTDDETSVSADSSEADDDSGDAAGNAKKPRSNRAMPGDHWLVDEAASLPPYLTVQVPSSNPWLGELSAECINLIAGFFEVRPSHRLGARDIQQLQHHPWFKENGVSDWGALDRQEFEPFFEPGKKVLQDKFTLSTGRAAEVEKYMLLKAAGEVPDDCAVLAAPGVSSSFKASARDAEESEAEAPPPPEVQAQFAGMEYISPRYSKHTSAAMCSVEKAADVLHMLAVRQYEQKKLDQQQAKALLGSQSKLAGLAGKARSGSIGSSGTTTALPPVCATEGNRTNAAGSKASPSPSTLLSQSSTSAPGSSGGVPPTSVPGRLHLPFSRGASSSSSLSFHPKLPQQQQQPSKSTTQQKAQATPAHLLTEKKQQARFGSMPSFVGCFKNK